MSTDIIWSVVRNNSAFILKKKNVSKPFSTDPMNLTSKNSKRYNGFVNKKAIGIAPAKDNKGFTVTLKKASKAHEPGKVEFNTTMKTGPGTCIPKLKKMISKQHYRRDLQKAALRKASAINRSQKPLPKRKGAKPAPKKAE